MTVSSGATCDWTQPQELLSRQPVSSNSGSPDTWSKHAAMWVHQSSATVSRVNREMTSAIGNMVESGVMKET